MPISFLILTYNSATYIKDLLDSIFLKLGPEIDQGKVEIIIVDNASSDQTIKLIGEFQGKINLHKSSKNLGYAKGINYAATFAKGELLVVINPDSKLVEFDLEKIVDEFQKVEKLAIAGLKIEDFNGVNEKTAGRFFNALTFFLYAFGLENMAGLRFSPNKKKKVDFVSGGFVIFRKRDFLSLNGYDEDYFMYVEDMDICFRAKKAGYDVQYLPMAIIQHKGQGSSSREFAIINIYKGLVTFYHKHGSFLEELYVRNLLSVKAALIIFVSALLSKKELTSTYTKALKAIS